MTPLTGQSSRSVFPGERGFRTPTLDAGYRFLIARFQDWGNFSDGLSGLYQAHICLAALAALQMGDPAEREAFRIKVANVELRARARVGERIEELEIAELGHLLALMQFQQDPNPEYVRRIAVALESRIERALQKAAQLRIRNLAVALPPLFAARASLTSDEIFRRCTQWLLSCEKKGDGGWPDGHLGDTSVIASAYVIQALRVIDPLLAHDAIKRGERFLASRVSGGGWQRLGVGQDTFVQAVVLHTLANCLDSTILEEGVVLLISSAGSAGWSLGPQQPTSIEATATVVIALRACGEGQFVPLREAASRLTEASLRAESTSGELTKLRQEIESEVARGSGILLDDRDQLRVQAKELRRTIATLEQRAQKSERDALEQAKKSQELLSFVGRARHESPWVISSFERSIRSRYYELFVYVPFLLFGLVIALAPSTSIRLFGAAVDSGLLGLLLIAMSTVAAMTMLWYRVQDSQTALQRLSELTYRSEESGGGPVTHAIRSFYDIASSLSQEAVEELNFTIMGPLTEMPRDVGIQYIRETMGRLQVARKPAERMLSWTADFLSMKVSTRRAIAEQIRRGALLR